MGRGGRCVALRCGSLVRDFRRQRTCVAQCYNKSETAHGAGTLAAERSTPTQQEMHAAASAGPGRHLLFPSTLTDTALRTVLSAPLASHPPTPRGTRAVRQLRQHIHYSWRAQHTHCSRRAQRAGARPHVTARRVPLRLRQHHVQLLVLLGRRGRRRRLGLRRRRRRRRGVRLGRCGLGAVAPAGRRCARRARAVRRSVKLLQSVQQAPLRRSSARNKERPRR